MSEEALTADRELSEFLTQWRSDSPTLTVRTSGSTGTPQAIEVEKERMRASARMTCSFLRLKRGDTALLCMSVRYIAGMMMVVRAEEHGLRLVSVEASGHPLAAIEGHIDFAAMVPLQVWNSLQVPQERERLAKIGTLIIGGGAINPDLERELATFPNPIFSTYGMTETLSHIALRRVGDSWYTPLPDVTLSQNEDRCLVIDAPNVCPTRLVTHDLVELEQPACPTSRFRILGRLDNVICSGGIKIQIEEVEEALRPTFGSTIQVTSRPHPKFGEEVVYLTTRPLDETLLRHTLPNAYWMPRTIIRVDQLPLTETGKPNRSRAKELAREPN